MPGEASIADVHLTIANVDRSRVPADELAAVSSAAGADSPPFTVQVRDIAMTSRSVYARA